ncbi:NADH dehydrogenase subunit L [Propioniferax innocua]|uniref:NADH dehydrogenase subunit L n=2 Tax=Propioniferax innocua TaxID=1753 RepID=A0A542ZDA8_9ACTN|nr:NADH dehydrogenase subunit L [Propioniferax innocua]
MVNPLQTAILEPVAASGLFQMAWLMIAIPLVSAAFLLLVGKASNAWGHLLATLAPIASFGIGLALFFQLLGASVAERTVEVPVYEWIGVGPWDVQIALLVDQLSILFVLLITGVGSLIHIYSIGYMEHDERRRRFFAYLNLFIAAMLVLVLANSYLVLFIGWEGVGLASYLLIGFWQHRPAAAAAAKKAFVMNRVGDIGMALAMITMFAHFGSVEFAEVGKNAAQFSPLTATLVGLFLLLAACGKSAQVPLQAWLLDAMEGPTPVSALIHAATMVTAGVYLIVRSGPIFDQTPVASTAVVVVGTVTLLVGAWIGTSKDDIKKVLAGSTMSQIGYMILAAGIGPAGYVFAIFHLLTHGFFKANMFLGAGSIMHGMDDDVNMRNFGALGRAMRWTFLTFAMGYLAIIGFPFFAGFYSKDHIIVAAFEHNMIVGICALIGAGITAYYMTRLMVMTFFGRKRWEHGVHPHESPGVMVFPLVVLAILSVVAGVAMNSWINGWLVPAVGGEEHTYGLLDGFTEPIGWLTMGVVAIGVVIAVSVFKSVPKEAPRGNFLERAARRDVYGDDINNAVVVNPLMAFIGLLTGFDRGKVDGAVEGIGASTSGLGQVLRRLQSGYVRSYGLTMVAGAVLVGAVLILGQLA